MLEHEGALTRCMSLRWGGRFVGIWEIDHENRKLQLVRGEFVSRPVARLMATESMVTRLGLSSTNMQPMESSQLMEDCNLLARLNKVPTASSQKGETASATVLTWVQVIWTVGPSLRTDVLCQP